MVELRKRKTPPPAPVRPAKKKAAPKTKVEKAKEVVAEKVEAVKEAVTGKGKAKANGEKVAAAPAKEAATAPSAPPKAGDTIDLTAFGGEIETHEGTKTTLAKLVEESKSGVVLFTYPKASTRGCTTQACLFRDSYEPLTAGGLAIYGLSNDSPKANTNFKTKQNLQYPLLCDPAQTLISAIGLKKAPKGTTRGVFVVDKSGKVLAAEPGSPEGTVAVVKKIVAGSPSAGGPAAPSLDGAKEAKDVEMANTADEVADTAAKVDSKEA
ncbi:AhpC-TSA-domain-containing protein [Lentithecium fluviatile CBS 122367]|uniref:thioredoxin-dependent peroxiredoxin n=1 Tax=Lentithecium fluviatile CBS 122367 TaxID=1168545 RepID=A0A6G1IGN3_9PLEO|nr:AhpC-TSA-domain-containing protein [Lentithecium fluviatile CBS 122367]